METRTLIVIRHAAAVAGCSSSDRLRNLSREGVAQARVLGAKLSGSLAGPLAVYISPANRTVQTWQTLSASAGLSDEVAAGAEQRDEIYWQWADELLAMVRQTPEGAHTVVVVGHEPTVSSLVALAAAPGLDIPRGMPTGSAVILSGAAEWERWAEGTATEAVFVH